MNDGSHNQEACNDHKDDQWPGGKAHRSNQTGDERSNADDYQSKGKPV